jgi:hypothetical protein
LPFDGYTLDFPLGLTVRDRAWLAVKEFLKMLNSSRTFLYNGQNVTSPLYQKVAPFIAPRMHSDGGGAYAAETSQLGNPFYDIEHDPDLDDAHFIYTDGSFWENGDDIRQAINNTAFGFADQYIQAPLADIPAHYENQCANKQLAVIHDAAHRTFMPGIQYEIRMGLATGDLPNNVDPPNRDLWQPYRLLFDEGFDNGQANWDEIWAPYLNGTGPVPVWAYIWDDPDSPGYPLNAAPVIQFWQVLSTFARFYPEATFAYKLWLYLPAQYLLLTPNNFLFTSVQGMSPWDPSEWMRTYTNTGEQYPGEPNQFIPCGTSSKVVDYFCWEPYDVSSTPVRNGYHYSGSFPSSPSFIADRLYLGAGEVSVWPGYTPPLYDRRIRAVWDYVNSCFRPS